MATDCLEQSAITEMHPGTGVTGHPVDPLAAKPHGGAGGSSSVPAAGTPGSSTGGGKEAAAPLFRRAG